MMPILVILIMFVGITAFAILSALAMARRTNELNQAFAEEPIQVKQSLRHPESTPEMPSLHSASQ